LDGEVAAGQCLDDNVAARFLAREVSVDERDAIERHLDACSRCTRLLAELARIYSDDSALPVPDIPPTEIGRYRIESVLGRGGMGVVYVAFDPTLGRRVAIKLLKSALASGRGAVEARERLLREARVMAKLSDPHVVPVYDVGVHQECPFLVMELVHGLTLRAWMQTGPHGVDEILRVFRQAARGLRAAHAAGLVHRDFKPENVLIDQTGARVTDFGLTRVDPPTPPSGEIPNAPLTETGSVLGTPAYMAPEQLFGQVVDARADQFAFAACLYEALYGTLPFPGRDLNQLRWRVATQRFEAPVTRRSVPRWVTRALGRALSADPERRYASMEELSNALGGSVERQATWHVRGNMFGQTMLLPLHVLLLLVVLKEVRSPSPAEPITGWLLVGTVIMAAYLYLSLVGWLWVPLNIWGLARRKEWARWSSLGYAIVGLPTCFATPYSVYALWSLTRSSVKAEFDGVSREAGLSPRGESGSRVHTANTG
jgi:eukaryotic-like serine/threonine-protein kinase